MKIQFYKEKERNINKSKLIKWIISVSILIPLITVTTIDGVYGYKTISTVKALKTDIYSIKSNLENKNIDNLENTIDDIDKNLFTLDKNLSKFILLDKLPIISTNIKLAKDTSTLGEKTINIFNDIYPKIKPEISEIINSDDIKIKNILSIIDKTTEKYDLINEDLDDFIIYLDKYYNKKTLFKPIKNEINNIYSNYYNDFVFIKKYLPVIKSAPDIFGLNKTSRYLLLFENNTELRATGGFIGTYGIIDFYNGEITKLFTDNIYNLDNSAINRLNIPAPEYFSKNFTVKKMYMRDANYNPDFEESAKYIVSLYKKESLSNYPISGVIALTPDVLEDIVGYFGEITVTGEIFRKENVIDLLNYETKFGYWQDKNIPASQRKEIIQKMANVLYKKITALPLNDFIDLVELSVITNLNDKQIVIYSSNDNIQNFLEMEDWAGKIIDTGNEADYLSVVDMNLGSGKTDKYINRSIDYNLKYINNELKAVLTLNYYYDHNSYISNEIYQDDPSFVNYYKAYTRIYVPENSSLISFYIDDEKINIEDIDITNENNKTSFGFYYKISTNTSKTFTIEYTLPKELTNYIINNNKYSIVFQKQIGIDYANVIMNVKFKKQIYSYSISSFNETDFSYINRRLYNGVLNINGKMFTDYKIEANILTESELENIISSAKRNYLSFNKQFSIR